MLNISTKMSPPPPAKRRRVDSLGIHKPFVSPLKRNNTSNPTSTPETPNQAHSTSATRQTPKQPYTPIRSSVLKPSTTPSSTPHPDPDPEIAELQTDIRALDHRIRDLRAQNNVLSQAASISTSTTPPRLQILAQKWRCASQAAADEVFGDFEARVRDHGGYAAFVRQQREVVNLDDQDVGGQGGEEDEWRDEMGEALTAREKRERRREAEAEEEEQELGMKKMLEILNIAEEDIGWDEVAQAWA